jgi:hypothetical protein
VTTQLNNSSLLDFWGWAFSDLCDDDLKGIFAEWLVLRLLNIPSSRRISWANSDIITPAGVRIEVKSTSYWQSWKLLDEAGIERSIPLRSILPESKVRFAGLKARNAVGIPDSAEPLTFKSHVYVFALQKEREAELWNAMDLSQWEFYALPASTILDLGWRSVSLSTLRAEQKKLSGHERLTAETFPEIAGRLIEDAARSLRCGQKSSKIVL